MGGDHRRSTEGLLVTLALGRSRRRPPIPARPTGLGRDIRAFFGRYSAGCRRADEDPGCAARPRAVLWHAVGVLGRRAGLLDETATIGTRAGWAERLRERGHALRGHRLVRCRPGGLSVNPDAT